MTTDPLQASALELPRVLARLSEQLEALAPERGLRIAEVSQMVGLGKSRIYELVAQGRFPAPRKSGGATLWLQSEVTRWLRSLPVDG